MSKGLKKQLSFETWTVDWLKVSSIRTLLIQIFPEALDYHAPVKQKVVRGNQAPFIIKDAS